MSLTPLRILFVTRRGVRGVTINSLACFGLISASLQFYSVLYGTTIGIINPAYIICLTAFISLAYGIFRTWPKNVVSRTFTANAHDISVTIKVGDILSQNGQIVIGFSDTFDTDTTNNKIISSKSLQGQMLAKKYNGDLNALDLAISTALTNTTHSTTERRSSKEGKLTRYPIGTVAILEPSANERIYALAYSKMNNNLVAESSVHEVWEALGRLWTAVYEHGQQAPIAMPLVGTKLARINYLDRESMLRMTLLSFVARSREKHFCSELTVLIHESDRDKINMLELAAFLRTL